MTRLTPIESVIDVIPNGNQIIYTSRSHVPTSRNRLSFLKIMECLAKVFYHTRQGMFYSKRGDMDRFEYRHALIGAKGIDVCRMKVIVSGLQNLSRQKTYIFAPTHGSLLDMFLLFLILKEWHLGFVSKRWFIDELFPSILIGKAMKASGRVFFVEPGEVNNNLETLDALSTLISRPSNRLSIVVFPQGGRTLVGKDQNGHRIDGGLYSRGPLQAGVSYMAMETLKKGNPTDIVPVIINGTNRIWPRTSHPIMMNQGVSVIVTEPITPGIFVNARRPVKELLRAVDTEFKKYHGFFQKRNADSPASN